MPYDIDSKHGNRDAKLDALARRCRLGDDDEARALSVYHDMIEAVADRVAGRGREPSPPPPVVYIAAYQHRFGVDLSAHRSRDNAESQLLSIAWKQCMRDPAIRAAVDARFGPLVSEEPPLEHPFEGDLCSSYDELEPPIDAEYGHPSPDASCGFIEPHVEDIGCGSGHGDHVDRHEQRRRTFCEQLLEEWPDFAQGELLWIVECILEDEDGVHDPKSRRGDSPDDETEEREGPHACQGRETSP